MTTILAASFTSALSRLANDEQKQAKLTAYDLQTNPDQPGLQMHRIDKSRDPNFWSVRVSRDLRIIVHKSGGSLMLVYVGHHDEAYKWAERRVIDAHPTTGAIQIREVRELVEEVTPPHTAGQTEPLLEAQVRASAPVISPPLFDRLREADLLSIGVPQDWVADVLGANEEQFYALAAHLPQEASEGLLDYAVTGILMPAVTVIADPLTHPDTLRRFRVLDGIEELKAALDAPFERWAVFLHPSQRGVVQRNYSGPARVAGSAGTGKTVVALHRVVRILRENPDARVLLTTFSDPLARNISTKLRLLCGDGSKLPERVTIGSFDAIAKELLTLATGKEPRLASEDMIRSMLAKAAEEAGVHEVTPQFLNSEWTHVIDAWQIENSDTYASVPRMGRKNRLGPKQRERLWSVFGIMRQRLAASGLMTKAGVFAAATKHFGARLEKPFTHIVVDEAQDLGVAELRFLAAIAPETSDALFFSGDLGQRIFQQPFSWKVLGVDIRGRSTTLKVNYRTSHQIRRAADRLLPGKVRDVDGNEDVRLGTISVFDGPEPFVLIEKDEEAEIAAVGNYLKTALSEGFKPGEIGMFVRSENQLDRARSAARFAGLPMRTFVDPRDDDAESALVGIMHLAKGLEFRFVVLMACDENVLPLEERVADVADDFELDEVIATERQLFYVASTRARDRLVISAVAPGSEFIEDFVASGN